MSSCRTAPSGARRFSGSGLGSALTWVVDARGSDDFEVVGVGALELNGGVGVVSDLLVDSPRGHGTTGEGVVNQALACPWTHVPGKGGLTCCAATAGVRRRRRGRTFLRSVVAMQQQLLLLLWQASCSLQTQGGETQTRRPPAGRDSETTLRMVDGG